MGRTIAVTLLAAIVLLMHLATVADAACAICSLGTTASYHCYRNMRIPASDKLVISPGKVATNMQVNVYNDGDTANACTFKVYTVTATDYATCGASSCSSYQSSLTQTSAVTCYDPGSQSLSSSSEIYSVVIYPTIGGECKLSASLSIVEGTATDAEWTAGVC